MEKKTIHPRKLARQMAKSQLDKAKVTGYNKEPIGPTGRKTPSLFSRKWRELAVQAIQPKPKKKRSRA